MTDPITQAREIYNGLFGDPEERNAGIVLATNLLRTLTSEGAEDEIGCVIAKRMWGDQTGTCMDRDRATARAVISHLLAQAIGEG